MLRCCLLTWRPTLVVLLGMVGCAHQSEWTSSDRLIEGIAAFAPILPPEARVPPRIDWHDQSLCSVWAEDADREALVHSLLEGSTLAYSCPPFSMQGRLTLRLHHVSVIQALNACLRDLELEASLLPTSPPLVVIRETAERPFTPPSSESSPAESLKAKSFVLAHASAQDLVSSLFKGTNTLQGLLSSQAIALQVGVSSEANCVYLRGPSQTVERALQMARLADQPTAALRVEVFSYVSRPNQDSLQTSARWQVNQGPFSLAWDPSVESASGTSNPLILDYQGSDASNDTLNFQALHSRQLGELLSRAELVVVSGQSVLLNVGKTGYIIVPEFENGTPAATTKPIDVGTKVLMTPVLLPDGSVRISLNTESSKFNLIASGNTSSSIIGNKNLNQRKVTVQVPQRSIILVGGLRRPQSSFTLFNGLSSLRRLPGVGRLFGNVTEDETLEQVMTLVRISKHEAGLLPSQDMLIPSALPVCDMPDGLTNLPN